MLKTTSNAAGADWGLIRACRRGDKGAWKRLLDKYERLVFSIPLRYGLSKDDAADVAQLAFEALLQAIDDLPKETNLGAWLTTVTRRKAWRVLDLNRRESSTDPDYLTYDAALLGAGSRETIEHWELLEWLDYGLRRVGGPCRELLFALYFRAEQPSYAEVAKRLDMPVGSIGPTRARCVKRLKRVLEGA